MLLPILTENRVWVEHNIQCSNKPRISLWSMVLRTKEILGPVGFICHLKDVFNFAESGKKMKANYNLPKGLLLP